MLARRINVRQLPVNRAFHSSLMDDAAAEFEREVAGVDRKAPTMAFTSNLEGGWARGDAVQTASYWARQLRCTARYSEQLHVALRDASAVVVDLSPRQGFDPLVLRHPAYAGQPVLSARESAPPYGVGSRGLLGLVGSIWCRGRRVVWSSSFHGRDPMPGRVRLPTYAFDRKRCWVDPAATNGSPMNGASRESSAVATRDAEASIAPPPPDTASPQTEMTAFWRRILDDRPFAIDENFFAAGGTSLLATQLMTEIERIYGDRPPLREFFENPTIRYLANWLAARPAIHTAAGVSRGRELVEV
jgi:acyl transferase domain-containing protein